MKNNIIHYCNIKDGSVSVNGKSLYVNTVEKDFLSFIKTVYKQFDLAYPKFYKMDPLCKLSIVAASILLENTGSEIDPNMALVLSNKSSCIDIDRKHQETISQEADSYASPANFVYTLPNIALGEISIKYKLQSENSFFIFEYFNPKFLIDYTNSLIDLGKSNRVLSGWVEVNENNYNAFLFIVEKSDGIELTQKNLIKLK
ncbi:3-oxoacyl-ACP synthase [Brumimicrobium aurantiacum]|uniref:3-oxoacyl-ACP synthase n=1 Tax=Brumimicrobium aurantiacum TaxID=1737063 RepID=A0A3E1EZD4_9FLAO|nr:3-oxoacyl-ACP synthase [Brumimicrobium aurantiacum]RFC54914.1 3-oxoacyl-ACP synthase [Brumimicrobium aurantiacum]